LNGWLTFSYDSDANKQGHNVLLHSSDGGKNWTPLAIPTPPNNTFDGCQFDTLAAFGSGALTFVVYCYAPNNPGTYLYHTSDESKTWRIATIPQYDGEIVAQVSPDVVWVIGHAGESGDLFWYQTLDGGQNWQQLAPLPTMFSGDVAFFDFIDAHTGWGIDAAGRLNVTTDSGQTWTPLSAQVEP